jgi:hypothetical protein
MSTENVDLIRGHWQAWEDDRDVETLVAGTEYMRGWTGYWTDARRFVDGGDRVLVEVREGGHVGGVEKQRTWAMVCTVCDLRTVRVEMFTDVAEAERSLVRQPDKAV